MVQLKDNGRERKDTMINNKNLNFELTESEDNLLISLSHREDPYKMNWVEGNTLWGTVKVPKGIETKISRSFTENGHIKERFEFINSTEFDIFSSLGDFGIYTTFNDNYSSSTECLTNKCHAHIWCGHDIAYVMGLRMGGEGPHLGLIVTEGTISQYSVERDINEISNDRGDFILHPSPVSLHPNESYIVEWELFWHQGKEDFYQQLLSFPHYYKVEADKYIYFQGEEVNVKIESRFLNDTSQITIQRNGNNIPFDIVDQSIKFSEKKLQIGSYDYSLSINNVKSSLSILVLSELKTLVENRCHFIVQNQQYSERKSALESAYLIYDNEEKHKYYSHYHDHNGGRERVSMGIIIAKYLQMKHNDTLEKSLINYVDYIKRELYDGKTGEVYNDVNRNNDIHRLYNYPWFAILFKELFLLWRNEQDLLQAYKILMAYYRNGGAKFYPIELAMAEILELLEQAGLYLEKDNLFAEFEKHINQIIAYGTNYPSSEVNFEQTIVAPAADCLLDMYFITKDKLYLEEAEKHLTVLELFNGKQPDYHLFETAIRHWDGYWFGKGRLYGDTFPHYWSAYSGRVFEKYYKATSSERYHKKAEDSLRGVLSLFYTDGSASCAHLYPFEINGIKGSYSDPWANDQDWGLYFMVDYEGELIDV